MDNFKKYLQHHLNELDNDVPDEALWQKIQQSSIPALPKRNVVKMVVRYVAAACVLAAIATTVFLWQKKPNHAVAVLEPSTNSVAASIAISRPADVQKMPAIPEVATSATEPLTPAKTSYAKSTKPKLPRVQQRTSTIDPGQLLVQDVERNYAQLVHYQLQRLRATPVYAESPQYFSTFKQQLRQVEADEAAIKKEIRRHGLTDELLQQLINISQQKLTVLKDLQTEIHKLNNKVQPPANRADSSQAFYLTM